MEELLKHLGFATPFIYAAAAYGLFQWLDKNASDDAKVALARTMRFKDCKSQHVASALVEVFDRIYTYPLLRWRAFFRSLLFTTVVSAIFILEIVLRSVIDFGVTKFEVEDVLILETGVLPFWLFNVFSDYLSLFARSGEC